VRPDRRVLGALRGVLRLVALSERGDKAVERFAVHDRIGWAFNWNYEDTLLQSCGGCISYRRFEGVVWLSSIVGESLRLES
jgi:hypothetical protein